MSKPKGRESGENKLNRVQEGGLDVSEGELGGPQVLAYFGTDVDRGGAPSEWAWMEGWASARKGVTK